MANRARYDNELNHGRQRKYLEQGIVMLPTKMEERKSRKKKK